MKMKKRRKKKIARVRRSAREKGAAGRKKRRGIARKRKTKKAGIKNKTGKRRKTKTLRRKRKAAGKRKSPKRSPSKKGIVRRRRVVKRIHTRKLARRRKEHKRVSVPRRPAVRSVGGSIHKPTYALDTDFEFFYELKDLISKSSPAEKGQMVDKLNRVGRIKLAIASGVFINKENLDPLITDLLIVGDDIDRRKLRTFLRSAEAEVGKEIRFTVMDKDEFQYRLAMFDRFVRVLLEGPHEKLINRLGI